MAREDVLTDFIAVQDVKPAADGSVETVLSAPLLPKRRYSLAVQTFMGTRVSDPAFADFTTGPLFIADVGVVKVKSVTTTSAIVSWNRVKSAMQYLVEVIDTETLEDIMRTTMTGTNVKVPELLSGTSYTCGVYAVGRTAAQSQPVRLEFFTVPLRSGSLVVEKVEQNSVAVIMGPVPNGRAQSYNLRLYETETEDRRLVDQVEVAHAADGNFRIEFDEGLTAGTKYVIQVYGLL